MSYQYKQIDPALSDFILYSARSRPLGNCPYLARSSLEGIVWRSTVLFLPYDLFTIYMIEELAYNGFH